MKLLNLPGTIVWYYIAFGWSFFDLLQKLTTYRNAGVSFSILLVLLVFSTADGIDALAYLYWPGLVILGMAFNRKAYSVERENLLFMHLSVSLC
jgi:hypothetical protein